jgi:hypothetical protein
MNRYYTVKLQGKVVSHGYLDNNQVLSTIHEVIYFDNYDQYVHECNINGIDPIDEVVIIIPEKITTAQLKLWLNRSGKLKAVNEFINNSDNEELKIMWEYATEWHYVNEQLQELAQHFEIDLKEAFRQAAEILV